MAEQTAPVDNPVSSGVQAYHKLIPSPLLQALIAGGATYAIAREGWQPIVETIRSVARVPGKAMSGMSDDQWQAAMDELKNDSNYRYWLPAAFGSMVAGADLATHYQPSKQYNGWMQWNAPTVLYKDTRQQFTLPKTDVLYTPQQRKSASLCKQADDLFQYGGYVPQLDLSQTINARQAQSLFTNDPFLQNQPYARNMGTAIVANAAMTAGTNNPTLGNVFDSAVNKIQNKLSFEGLASVGVKTVVANGTARLFAGALGAMTDLNPTLRQNIVDAGTWAGAITAILQ